MQSHANGRMPRQYVEERQVGLLVGAFDHVIEIPDRLVRMHEEDELKFRHPGPR